MMKNERGLSSIIGIVIVVLLVAILGVLVYAFIFKNANSNPNYNTNANTNSDEWSITNANSNAKNNTNYNTNLNTNNNANNNTNSGANLNTNINSSVNTNQEVAEMGEQTIVLTNPNSDTKYSGTATKKFVNGKYTLIVETGLPEALKGQFYAVWIERPLPYHVVSIGKMEKRMGQYVIEYSSATNYNNHPVLYVTLEPEDNNPAPTDNQVLIGRFNR